MKEICELQKMQDHTDVAKLWGDLIDWPNRLKKEGPFLTHYFNKHHCHRIFDTCLGDGVDSIYLLQHGFSVVSNEPDAAFLKKATQNAADHGVKLETVQYDWRDLDQYAPDNLFDAIFCLGNSFTYLFEEQDRELVLTNFRKLLRPGGLFIVDERNYPYMLANREKILNEGAPPSPSKGIFTGSNVVARPIAIEDSLVTMHYLHKESKQEAQLFLYPFKKDELRTLLEGRFDYLDMYSDFNPGYNPDAGLYQHVCVNNK